MTKLDAQIAELRRELAVRRRVYPRWVGGGRLTQEVADERIDALLGAIDSLTRYRASLQQPSLFQTDGTHL